MRLIHRLTMFNGLLPKEPWAYGFDTAQIAIRPFVSGDMQAVLTYASGIDPRLKLLLALTPEPNDALFQEAVDENWYATIRQYLVQAMAALGSRVIAVRFNHEWRSSIYKQTAAWEAWLRTKNYAMFQYVVLYQRSKWNRLIEDTKMTVHPVAFLEQTSGTDWDKPSNADFRTTFKLWVEYRCLKEAEVFNRLGAMAGELGLPLYLYPGGRNTTVSPRLIPDVEYTLDQRLLTDSNIILEMGGWSSFSKAWVDAVSASTSMPFMWTNQLDLRYLDAASPENEYNWRMGAVNAAGLHSLSYGFWSDWNPTARPDLAPQIQAYVDSLKTVWQQ